MLIALKSDFIFEERNPIAFYEALFEMALEDYQVKIRENLSKSRNPLTFLYLAEKRFMKFKSGDYVASTFTYDAMEVAGLAVEDIDAFADLL